MSYEIEVENIKCGGCASTIVKRLSELESIKKVDVDVERGVVQVAGDELARAEVCVLLEMLGYPETGSARGMSAVKAKAKSFVSCAVGRFADEPSEG